MPKTAMALTESSIAKIGLVALALVEWRHAALIVWGGFMPLHPFAIGLVLALYLTSFALILTALVDREVDKPQAWWLAPMLLVLFAFAYHDALHKTQSGTFPTTDANAYMDVAARTLLQGK